jgi:hypothetical protein
MFSVGCPVLLLIIDVKARYYEITKCPLAAFVRKLRTQFQSGPAVRSIFQMGQSGTAQNRFLMHLVDGFHQTSEIRLFIVFGSTCHVNILSSFARDCPRSLDRF